MSKKAFTRIGCVQFAPVHGQPKENADTVLRLTSSLQPGEVDILMLPEMALSGYVFTDALEITPLLEDPRQGIDASPSLKLAHYLSRRLECYVVIGFPSKAACFDTAASAPTQYTPSICLPHDARPRDTTRAVDLASASIAYNASMLIDAHGQIVHIFRKHFNYEADKVWATEGPGFETVNLQKIGKVCVAICMDINPYDYKAPFEAFELARFCQERNVDILLMNMAWLTSEGGGAVVDESDGEEDSSETERTYGRPPKGRAAAKLSSASLNHCNYLATRLTPCIIGARPSMSSSDDDASNQSASLSNLAFVTCNRIGIERGSQFCGSSFALDITPHQRPNLVGMMGANEQGVAIFEVKRGQAVSEAEEQ